VNSSRVGERRIERIRDEGSKEMNRGAKPSPFFHFVAI
jgi:hypothetical protein